MRKSNARRIADLLAAVIDMERRQWHLSKDVSQAREMAALAQDLASAARSQRELCDSMASGVRRLADKIAERDAARWGAR